MSAITRYIQGAIHELREVRWPTQRQAIRLSVITIIFTFATAAAYGLIDFILEQFIGGLLTLI